MLQNLEKLGLDAARDIAGDSAVDQVELVPALDALDRPKYRFIFRIDLARSKQPGGMVKTKLIQRLRDALDASGDEHSVGVTLLDRVGWERRPRD